MNFLSGLAGFVVLYVAAQLYVIFVNSIVITAINLCWAIFRFFWKPRDADQ